MSLLDRHRRRFQSRDRGRAICESLVGEAGDGDALLQMLRQKPVDVVLLDVTMPGPGVLDLVPAIKQISSRTRILILTMHSEQMYGRRVLEAGADGYLTKAQSSSELATAIRHVDSGHKFVTQSLAEELASELAARGNRQPHESRWRVAVRDGRR